MLAFILRRLAQALMVMLSVAFVAFMLFQHVGDPVTQMLGQDATPDDGVSRSYVLRHMRSHERSGWLASYPETTGYIIPTFFAYAALTGKSTDTVRQVRNSMKS